MPCSSDTHGARAPRGSPTDAVLPRMLCSRSAWRRCLIHSSAGGDSRKPELQPRAASMRSLKPWPASAVPVPLSACCHVTRLFRKPRLVKQAHVIRQRMIILLWILNLGTCGPSISRLRYTLQTANTTFARIVLPGKGPSAWTVGGSLPTIIGDVPLRT